ncbi:MAG TPA: WYL domain-containing protein [Candidatus Binatus sp.]|nr:WYL domain-containing protein [Candidatus Binatus sp.]
MRPKPNPFVALLEELDSKREITVARCKEIYGKQFAPATWKRIKKRLEAEGCKLRWDAKSKKFTVVGSWARAKSPPMDPRKRELLAMLRVDVSRLGSPFVEGIGPQLDRWDEQLAELDPEATEQMPVRQPQPRMDKNYYECLKVAERAVRDRTILRFKYRRSRDNAESRRAIAPYALYDYNGRIYVWGPEEGAPHPKFFALDGMTEAQSSERDTFLPAPGMNLDDALKHSFGIYVAGHAATLLGHGRKILLVVVRFAPHRAGDVRARRWPTEVRRQSLDDGSVEISFVVDDPRELVAWVLSFGGDAKIMTPPEAAQMARTFAESIRRAHQWAENVPIDDRLLHFEWGVDESRP